MSSKTNLSALFEYWKSNPQFLENVSYWGELPKSSSKYIDFPEDLDSIILSAIHSSGISQLYTHQRKAWDAYHDGNNICISTGTGSGKSLAYNLIVFNEIIQHQSTALYIFPTKALSQDQKLGIRVLNLDEIIVGTYDGDTLPESKLAMRNSANLVISNPDMLNIGILPRHNSWQGFFEKLQVVVIDEIHTYRGVFGSHVSNVLSRLHRIASYYGRNPRYILTSATLRNPKQHAQNLISREVELIDESSSGSGKHNFIIYNPPIINHDLEIRESVFDATLRITRDLSDFDIQTIVFGRARNYIERLNLAFKNLSDDQDQESTRAYRSGYHPEDRRNIERDIRSGTAKTVFATNALELGIDYGGIDAIVMSGYPGSIASTRQQSGRAGRKSGESLAIMIAAPNPIDQFIVNNPTYLTSGSPESALINPGHLAIALQHIKASIFELPLDPVKPFTHLPAKFIQEVLAVLIQQKEVNSSRSIYYWIGKGYPSSDISLRSSTNNTLQILLDAKAGSPSNLGTMDFNSVDFMVHPGAVYLHDGRSYIVDELDYDRSTVRVLDFDGHYFTQASQDSQARILDKSSKLENDKLEIGFGDLQIARQVTGYKRIDSYTGRILERLPLSMPRRELLTQGFWLSLKKLLIHQIENQSSSQIDRNDYGSGWQKIRNHVLERDQHTCQNCHASSTSSPLHVHHIIPFRKFADASDANDPGNLITLCPACHRLAETNLIIQSGLTGVGYLLNHVASIFLMCAHNDLSAFYEPSFKEIDGNPTIIVFENIPGGLGFSSELFGNRGIIVEKSLEIINRCLCSDGCPSCVGPGGSEGSGGKSEARIVLAAILENLQHANLH